MGHKDKSSNEKSENDCPEAGDHKHKHVQQKTKDGLGYWGSVVHIVRAAVGTGILVLPFEMKNLGYITGSLLLLAVTFIYYHIIHIFLHLNFRICEHLKLKHLTHALLVEKIFSIAPAPFRKYSNTLPCIIYIIYMIPISKGMALIIISTSIQNIANYNGVALNFHAVLTSLTIILTICCLFRSVLRALVPFSSASNLCSFTIVIFIMIYSFMNKNPNVHIRPFAGDVTSILRSMVVYINAASSTYILLPVSNNMQNPQHMISTFGSVNVSAIIIGVLYTSFALITYINFGDNIQEDILATIPVGDLLTLSINLVYSMALIVPYVLYFYACYDVVWISKFQVHLADHKFKCIVEYGFRIGYNATAYLIAVGASNLALISAIAGVFSLLIDVAMMPFLQLLLIYTLKEKNYWIICRSVLLIAFCSILFVFNVIDCVDQVVSLYTS